MTTRARRLTLAALLSSMFMAAMEATVVATAMPSVVADLHGIDLYGWVGAIYLLTNTVSMPVFGKLADQRGRKPAMLWAISLFLLGSIASGAAQSMVQLIVARAVQGLGAGGIQPISLTVVGDLYRPEQRARIQGLFGSVWALAGVSGPLLGGFFVTVLSWRWVFYVNVPFGVLAALLLVTYYSEEVEGHAHRLDIPGALTLSVGVVCLLLGVGESLPELTLPAAALALGAFIFVERRAAEPLVPLDLMRIRLLATSNVICILLGAVMMGVLLYVPLYVQAILLGTPTDAGMSITPMMLGWPLASALSGRLLVRFGYRRMVRVGGLLVLLSSGVFLLPLEPGSGQWVFRLNSFVLGTGLGFTNTAVVIAVQEHVSRAQRGVATAALLFFRTIGGALSAGALGALLATTLGDRVSPGALDQLLSAVARGVDYAPSPALTSALLDAMHSVFTAVIVISLLSWVATLAFPKQRDTPVRSGA